MHPSERNRGQGKSFARVVVGRLIAGRRYGVLLFIISVNELALRLWDGRSGCSACVL